MPPLTPPLTTGEIATLRFRYLTDETATIKALAADYGQPPYKVAQLLKGADYDAFKAEAQAIIRTAAADRLAAASEDAAALWLKSMPIAAARGDHRPMKELLIATKAIDPQSAAPQVVVQVGISLADVLLPGAHALPPAIDAVPIVYAALHPSTDVPVDAVAPPLQHVTPPPD